MLDEWPCSLPPQVGFKSGELQVNAMAFADDIIIMAATPFGLQQSLNSLEQFLAARRLPVNPDKCAPLSLRANAKDKITKIATDEVFKISGSTIPVLDTSAKWKYLGLYFKAFGLATSPILEEVEEYLRGLTKAPLMAQQRLVILRFYMTPRLLY